MGENDPRHKLIVPVAAVVMVGWLATLLGALYTRDYTGLTVTTPVMIILAGYAFGVSITRKPLDKKEEK